MKRGKMSWHKIKIRPADTLWSRYIRTIDRKCQFGIRCTPKERFDDGELDISYLDCVHLFSRRNESTRFDRENTHAGCKGCHKYLHDNPKEIETYGIKLLGQRNYDLLLIRVNTPLQGNKKMQDDLVKIFCKQELKESKKS